MEFKKGFLVDDWNGEIKKVEACLLEKLTISYSTYEKSFLLKTDEGLKIITNNYRNVVFSESEAEKLSEQTKDKHLSYLKKQREEYDQKIKEFTK